MKKTNIIIFVTLIFAACHNKENRIQPNTKRSLDNVVTLSAIQQKNAGIETSRFTTKKISTLLKVNGKIDVPPQSLFSISVPLGGYLKYTKLLPGMYINKGEVLAVMEDAQYIQLQQDYLTAKAQLSFSEGEYNRQKELNQSKATSDKVFEQTKSVYQTQNILIKSLEQKLLLIGLNPNKITANNISKNINIYSPVTGFVSSVKVNIGKYVNPSDVMFELVNPADIHLTLSVFEKDINKLSIGQKLVAYSNGNPKQKYPCEIILISKNLSDQNSTEVHCHFELYDKKLLPGTFMNAEIMIAGNSATVIADDAIVRYDNKQYIFIAKGNNVFAMQEIQTGNSENGFTEILNANELTNQMVVTKGAYNLLMASKNTNDE